MDIGTNDLFKQLSENTDPMIQAFIERSAKEDIVDLYVEYFNQLVDLEYQPDADTHEKTKIKTVVRECEQLLIQRVLREKGYDVRMMLKYVKKK